MTELPRELTGVWSIYLGLQFAAIISRLKTVLNTQQSFKLFGIIPMKILFTLMVLSAKCLVGMLNRILVESDFLL